MHHLYIAHIMLRVMYFFPCTSLVLVGRMSCLQNSITDGENTDPQHAGSKKLEEDLFGITVLLEYGMRIAVY